MKNNITRFLDSKKIPYLAHTTPIDKRTAVETAMLLEVAPAQVFKTMVVVRIKGGKAILGIIPGDKRLNLKAMAKVVGEKKVLLASHDEAEKITGLETGGISPLSLINKGFQMIIDETCQGYEKIFVSGGQRGLTIEIGSKDLIKLINGKVAQISN